MLIHMFYIHEQNKNIMNKIITSFAGLFYFLYIFFFGGGGGVSIKGCYPCNSLLLW